MRFEFKYLFTLLLANEFIITINIIKTKINDFSHLTSNIKFYENN